MFSESQCRQGKDHINLIEPTACFDTFVWQDFPLKKMI
jgi:hypothetical protein